MEGMHEICPVNPEGSASASEHDLFDHKKIRTWKNQS
jgi:hypothetical protein